MSKMLEEALSAPDVVAAQLADGGRVAAPHGTPGADLHIATAAHPLLEPIAAIQSFYLAAEALAQARGRYPDMPQYLSKVTETR